jgi:Signal transduction histidine kinase
MSKEIDGQELSSFMIGQLEKNVHDGKNIIIHNTQTDSGIYAGLNTYSYVTLLFHYGGQDKYLFTINQSSARNWLEDEVQLIYEIINRMFLRIERIRSEEALRQSEVKYRTLFENINEGFFLADIICDELGKPIDYMYLAANSALEKIFSMKNEEIIGKRGSEVLAIPNCWIEVLGNVALTGQPVTYEDFLVNVDSHFWIRVYSPAYGQFACLIKDISENKKLDIELKCQKEMFESVIENMHDALIIFNKEGYVIFMNAETRKLYPNMDIQTHISNAFSTFEFFDLKNNVILEEDLPMRRAFRGEKVRNERIITKRPDKIQYTEINATPIFDNKNNLSSLVVCHRDITELIQNQRRVKYKHNQLLRVEKEKRETLQADMKLKDEFLYLITHEFKTPMAVIYSALQAIDFICKDDVTERLGKYLNTIKNNTNRQLRLVNNLLDVTKINSGNIKLSRYNFDIVYVTKFIAKSVEIYAKQKKVNINFKSSIDKKVVYLDEEKFERIMLNLLSNALKFTKEGKSINVLLAIKRYENEDFISISVIDEGIGVQKDNQQMIFERFGQVDTNLSRQAEGTGLGLYLVNLLLKALDGKIFLESEVGKGSNFTVLLPMVKLSQCDETANSSDQNNQLIDGDNRIIRAISIEFSDIYFD